MKTEKSGISRADLVSGLECINGWYYYRRMVDGKRRRKSLRTKTLSIAVKKVVEMNEKVFDKDIPLGVVLSDGKINFESAGDAYINNCYLRKSSLSRYQTTFRNILKGLEEISGYSDIKLKQVTRALIEDYAKYRRTCEVSPNGHKNSRKQIGVSEKTLSMEISLVKAILKYSVTRQWLGYQPDLDGISHFKRKRGQPSSKARPLTEEETRKVLSEARKYDESRAGFYAYDNFISSLLMTYIYSGLRRKELVYLEWSDISFGDNLLRVRSKRIINTRTILLSDEAVVYFRKLLRVKKGKVLFVAGTAETKKAAKLLKLRSLKMMLAIRREWFDFDSKCLLLTEMFEWKPKASEGEVPLHPVLKERLQSLYERSNSNFVFPAPDGGYMTHKFERAFKKITAAAGIKENIRVHDLRHTTGTMLRRAGVPVESIMHVLRHANVEESLIYSHFTQDEAQRAINKFPKL